MRSVDKIDVSIIRMETSPLNVIVNAGMRIIAYDSYIYEYSDLKWVKQNLAEREDYLNIPQLL